MVRGRLGDLRRGTRLGEGCRRRFGRAVAAACLAAAVGAALMVLMPQVAAGAPAEPAGPAAQAGPGAQAAPAEQAAQVVGAAGLPGDPRFFPLDEIEPGMKGIGLSVFEGSRIDQFEVLVLGVLEAGSSAARFVLVELGGMAIDKVGGLAAGMSGSPVYVEGRLVGAISHGYEFSDHRLALVTPIHDMLEVWYPGAATPGRDVEIERALGVRAADLAAVDVRLLSPAPSGPAIPPDAVFLPVATPVMVSGLGQRSFSEASKWLSRLGVKAVPGGEGPHPATGGEDLKPGSAIGVQLLWGDMSMTGIGTVTYVEGGRALAFGHAVLALGDSDYRATGAYVHRSAKALDSPFKIATATGAVGRVDQDRANAVSVKSGEPSRGVKLHATVTDLDRGVTRELEAWAIKDERLVADLVGLFALGCVDLGLGRIGDGTSEVECLIRGSRGDGQPFELRRRNVFYSDEDIAAQALVELVEDTRAIAQNDLEDAVVENVELTAKVTRKRNTARIVRAEVSGGPYHPGDTVPVQVTLRPYRGATVVLKADLTLPEDCPEGTVLVSVRPGGEGEGGPGGEGGGAARATPAGEAEAGKEFENLSEMLDDMASRLTNTDLVVELIRDEAEEGLGPDGGADAAGAAGDPGSPGAQDGAPGRQAAKSHKPTGTEPGKGEGPEPRTVMPTSWVLTGAAGVEIEVEVEVEGQGQGQGQGGSGGGGGGVKAPEDGRPAESGRRG